MNREQIKSLALSCGFKLKQQEQDLNDYVYEFAEQLLATSTIRDICAVSAMSATLHRDEPMLDEHWRMGLALDSYLMADHMMKARGMKLTEKGWVE